MNKYWILGLTLSLISCNQNKTKEDKTPEIVQDTTAVISTEPNNGIGDGGGKGEGASPMIANYISGIEKAHKKAAFLNHKAVSFDIKISFGGKQRMDAKITMLTNSTKIRIDKKDSSKLIYDGDKAYVCPSDANDKGARFDMFTWTYFFGLPYKLDDTGTQWELLNNKTLNDKDHQTAKLTFDQGVGDAPDDWYIVYTDQENSTLQAAAYIVTFGSNGDTTKAESDPHAIQYKNFNIIDGIPFATTWEFNGWTSEGGMGEKIGEATISDITFLEEEGELFKTPAPDISKVIE